MLAGHEFHFCRSNRNHRAVGKRGGQRLYGDTRFNFWFMYGRIFPANWFEPIYTQITEIHHTPGDRYCGDEYWRQPYQGRHDRSSRWGKCGGLWKPSSPVSRHDGDYHSDSYEQLQK